MLMTQPCMSADGMARRRGFTIVELLIVVVIIAVLATITIVAFNGAQDRAIKASLAAELNGVAKVLKNDQTLNGIYPATLAAANNGAGVKVSSGVNLAYTFDNNVTPQTFMVHATSGKHSFIITQDGVSRENVLLGASATSPMLTDGLTATSPWFSTSPGTGLQSVTVTLPVARDVSTVKVWHYYGDSRTYYATKTEISADGTNWTTIFDSAVGGTYQETSAGKAHTFATTPVRYIRDWLNGSTANTGDHWIEIQAY